MVTPQSQYIHKLPQKRISQLSPNRWKMVHFYVLCSKNILMKLFGYQQPTCLFVKMDFVVGAISLSCELFSLSKARAYHMPMQLYWVSRLWGPRTGCSFLPDNPCAKELYKRLLNLIFKK